jgi:hypothetical protein
LTQRQLRKLITREFRTVTRKLAENADIQERRKRRRRKDKGSDEPAQQSASDADTVDVDSLDDRQKAARKRLAAILVDWEDDKGVSTDRVGRAMHDLNYLKQSGGMTQSQVSKAYDRIKDARETIERENPDATTAAITQRIEKDRMFYGGKGPQFQSPGDEESEESYADYVQSMGGDPDEDPAVAGFDHEEGGLLKIFPPDETSFEPSHDEDMPDSGSQAARVEIWNLPGDRTYEYAKVDDVWHARKVGSENWLSLAGDKFSSSRSKLDNSAQRA